MNYLFRHLLRVADCASVNLMETSNLCIVFGPTLFGAGGLDEMNNHNKIVESMIIQSEWMFDDSES